jgi:hypothetical protein
MYQPYPSGDADQVTSAPRPPAPSSVINAVRLMYVGGGLSILGLIFEIIALSSFTSALKKSDPGISLSRIHSLETTQIVTLAIICALWILMAITNRRGRSWARIVASVLFALNTILLLVAVSQTGIQAGIAVDVLNWLIGLGAIILLWRKDSTAYFQPDRLGV